MVIVMRGASVMHGKSLMHLLHSWYESCQVGQYYEGYKYEIKKNHDVMIT